VKNSSRRQVKVCISFTERKSLIADTAPRYRKAIKKQKHLILNEFVEISGLNRHYSAQVLRLSEEKLVVYESGQRVVLKADIRYKRKPPKRPPIYRASLIKPPLILLWKISDFLSSKRLAVFIRSQIDPLMQSGMKINPDTVALLKQISPATIDRILKTERLKYRIKGHSHTKKGKLIKGQIPIRTFAEWTDEGPGFLEIDLVGHDGGNLKGEHCFTLTVTDIRTGYTVLRALRNKAACWTEEALQYLFEKLPFQIRGLDSDNGSEFINDRIRKFCETNQITFTRSRPYKKNDGCFVEQKNNSVARKTIGYFRYEPDALDLMNELYDKLEYFTNYFQPSTRLISKVRVGSKVIKRYDKPQTPVSRLLSYPIKSENESIISQRHSTLNLLTLHQDIQRLKNRLQKLAVNQ
jgi:Integrase core domain